MFGRAAAVGTFPGSDEGTCRLSVVAGHDRCVSRIGLFGEPSLHDHYAFRNSLLREVSKRWLNQTAWVPVVVSILLFHDAPFTDYCQNSLIHNRNHGYRRASVLPPEVAQIAQSRF